MRIEKDKGVIRITKEETKSAKKEAIHALRAFLDKPDDVITLKEATQALKRVTTLLLENHEEGFSAE